MGFNVTGMADYIKSEGQVLITDLVLGGQSFSQEGIRIETGIKFNGRIVDLTDNETIIRESGGDPGNLSYTGGTSLKDIDVSNKELTLKELYVPNQLQSKAAQMQQRSGSDPESLEFYQDLIFDLKGNKVRAYNDKHLWQGDTGGTGYTHFDGWLTVLTKTGSTSVSGGSVTGFTKTNVLSQMESFISEMEDNFPEWIDNGAYIWMSPKQYSTYYRTYYALGTTIDANTINTDNLPDNFVIPGTQYRVYRTHGLQGKNNVVATRENNLIGLTDLESETDTLNFEYLTERMGWRLLGLYKLGAKIARENEVILTK